MGIYSPQHRCYEVGLIVFANSSAYGEPSIRNATNLERGEKFPWHCLASEQHQHFVQQINNL